jgi:hypothetical protein
MLFYFMSLDTERWAKEQGWGRVQLHLGGEDEEDGPSRPRQVRVIFEPEGTAEMALEEDHVVHVIGRGGGVGWGVVEKEDGGHEAVPESYLELVEVS